MTAALVTLGVLAYLAWVWQCCVGTQSQRRDW